VRHWHQEYFSLEPMLVLHQRLTFSTQRPFNKYDSYAPYNIDVKLGRQSQDQPNAPIVGLEFGASILGAGKAAGKDGATTAAEDGATAAATTAAGVKTAQSTASVAPVLPSQEMRRAEETPQQEQLSLQQLKESGELTEEESAAKKAQLPESTT
jgi:hypothetical protein